MSDAEDFDARLDATEPVDVQPKPGTLAYAQAVAEQHGDLEDAAIEDGMDPGKDVPACDCESMGGRFGSHRPECPWQIAFEAQLVAEKDADPPCCRYCGEPGGDCGFVCC